MNWVWVDCWREYCGIDSMNIRFCEENTLLKTYCFKCRSPLSSWWFPEIISVTTVVVIVHTQVLSPRREDRGDARVLMYSQDGVPPAPSWWHTSNRFTGAADGDYYCLTRVEFGSEVRYHMRRTMMEVDWMVYVSLNRAVCPWRLEAQNRSGRVNHVTLKRAGRLTKLLVPHSLMMLTQFADVRSRRRLQIECIRYLIKFQKQLWKCGINYLSYLAINFIFNKSQRP